MTTTRISTATSGRDVAARAVAARIVSGHFTPLEIAMTLVVAVAAIAGVIGAARFSRSVSPAVAVCLFATGAALQWACFHLSLLPGLVDR